MCILEHLSFERFHLLLIFSRFTVQKKCASRSNQKFLHLEITGKGQEILACSNFKSFSRRSEL